jgi:hypothetical protein
MHCKKPGLSAQAFQPGAEYRPLSHEGFVFKRLSGFEILKHRWFEIAE